MLSTIPRASYALSHLIHKVRDIMPMANKEILVLEGEITYSRSPQVGSPIEKNLNPSSLVPESTHLTKGLY